MAEIKIDVDDATLDRLTDNGNSAAVAIGRLIDDHMETRHARSRDAVNAGYVILEYEVHPDGRVCTELHGGLWATRAAAVKFAEAIVEDVDATTLNSLVIGLPWPNPQVKGREVTK